jgi:hypothetical protein
MLAQRLQSIDKPIIRDGLIGWYKFDEGSGSTANDSSGNGRNGTLVNMAAGAWVAGLVDTAGYALDFDGSNDRINLPAAQTAVFFKSRLC